MYSDFNRVVNACLSVLSFAGFDAVTLANNHLNDFGSKGANFTAEVLKKTGIKYFGISYGNWTSSQVVCFICKPLLTLLRPGDFWAKKQ